MSVLVFTPDYNHPVSKCTHHDYPLIPSNGYPCHNPQVSLIIDVLQCLPLILPVMAARLCSFPAQRRCGAVTACKLAAASIINSLVGGFKCFLFLDIWAGWLIHSCCSDGLKSPTDKLDVSPKYHEFHWYVTYFHVPLAGDASFLIRAEVWS